MPHEKNKKNKEMKKFKLIFIFATPINLIL